MLNNFVLLVGQSSTIIHRFLPIYFLNAQTHNRENRGRKWDLKRRPTPRAIISQLSTQTKPVQGTHTRVTQITIICEHGPLPRRNVDLLSSLETTKFPSDRGHFRPGGLLNAINKTHPTLRAPQTAAALQGTNTICYPFWD